MKNKTECNLIKDLLPLYVDNLVSEENKEEIKKHLKECNKCLEELENIKKENGQVIDEILINNNKEVKCVKKIKRKIRLKIFIAIIMSVLLTYICIKIYNPYIIVKNEEGKYILYNTNTGNIQKGKYGISIIAKYTEKFMGRDIEYYMVFTFDKNDKCINCRTRVSGYKERDMNKYKDNMLHASNIEIKDNKLFFNDDVYIGKSKKIVIEILNGHKAEIIEV